LEIIKVRGKEVLTSIIYKKMGLRCKKKNVEAMSLFENNK